MTKNYKNTLGKIIFEKAINGIGNSGHLDFCDATVIEDFENYDIYEFSSAEAIILSIVDARGAWEFHMTKELWTNCARDDSPQISFYTKLVGNAALFEEWLIQFKLTNDIVE
ncbi:MAG: hypothetical protein HC836_23320 [Richelia sp. RM2_1_2]|nr:hypothetical protein [Richelia sp. RM2_1_2]